MSTHDARALYSALLDGDLSPEEHADWQSRLALQTDLAADYAGFAASVGALRGLRPQALSESRVAAILAPFEAETPPASSPRWPQLLAWLATAAAIWWLLVLGGFGQLVESGAELPGEAPQLAHQKAGAERADERGPDARSPIGESGATDSRGQGAVATSAPSAEVPPRHAAPLVSEPWLPIAPEVGVQFATPAVVVNASPLPSANDPLGALSPSSGRPRLRASAGVHLVRGEQSTRLSLHGELSALIPELLALLDSEDAPLIQLTTTRLRLLQRDLVARGSLPAELGVDPLASSGEARRSFRDWFSTPPSPPSASAAWNEWWTLAREHLPRAQDADVL